jgi:NAD(P)-dependent dehydrogenase (short-subunit alcohol dehydrogenase family)
MGRLEGKVAVVTGGASGIGAATVRLFVEEGARVVIADLRARSVSVLGQIGGGVGRWGGLDILYNNAGFGGISGPLEETTVEEYDLTMDVLLKSVFLGIKHATPHLRARGGGAIVNTASVCAFEAGIGAQLYTVAKAGVAMMTKAAALELAEQNIRVNAVCPGYIATPLAAGRPRGQHEAAEVEAALERLRARVSDTQPLGRTGEPEDIARAVLFLASDEAEWITGEALVVDGGLLAGRPWRKLGRAITERREITMYRPE